MAEQARRRATYEDVLAAPDDVVAEVIDGELHTQPRPATLHARATSILGEELGPPFNRSRGGPGGWIILDEPELHLGSEPAIVVPDLAGWRRETMPELPDAAFLELRPDWLCEALTASTRAKDRVLKMPIYAREGVGHVWLLDPEARSLEVFRLDGETYRVIAAYADDAKVRAEPFEAIELDLAGLWMR